MKDIIREIWEIRGTIDEAIEKHDIELFNQARDRFISLLNHQEHLKTLSTATAGKYYETEEEFNYDRETNFSMIAYDLNRGRKEVLETNESTMRNIQFSSPLEVLWYTRDMFDTFVRTAKEGRVSKEENDTLFNAVDINLGEIIGFYEDMHDKTSINERISLRLIQKEIRDEYFKFYGIEYCENVTK